MDIGNRDIDAYLGRCPEGRRYGGGRRVAQRRRRHTRLASRLSEVNELGRGDWGV